MRSLSTVMSTSCSVSTLTTVPGLGASNVLHRGAPEVVYTMDAFWERSGPRSDDTL